MLNQVVRVAGPSSLHRVFFILVTFPFFFRGRKGAPLEILFFLHGIVSLLHTSLHGGSNHGAVCWLVLAHQERVRVVALARAHGAIARLFDRLSLLDDQLFFKTWYSLQ